MLRVSVTRNCRFKNQNVNLIDLYGDSVINRFYRCTTRFYTVKSVKLKNNSLKLRNRANFHATINEYYVKKKHLNKSDNKLRSIRKKCKQNSGPIWLQWF